MLRLTAANAIDSLVQMLLEDLRRPVKENMAIDAGAWGVVPSGHDAGVEIERLRLGQFKKRQHIFVVINMEGLFEDLLIEVSRCIWSKQFAQGLAHALQTGAPPAGAGDGEAIKAQIDGVLSLLLVVDNSDQKQGFQSGIFC